MVQLFGDPLNLQGGASQLQGGANPQTTANPQQPALLGPPQPALVTKPAVATPAAPKTTQAPVQAQPKQLNSLFNNFIGTRPSPVNPSVLEYYNKQTGQGFPNPSALFAFASQLSGQNITDFSQLESPAPPTMLPNSIPQAEAQPTDPNQKLAQDAARAGLSVDEYLKLAGGSSGLTQAERDSINQGLGIPDLENSVFTPPAKNTQQLYNEAYSMAGLADLKTQIQAKIAEVNKARSNYVDAEGTINENPWLAEASRVGRVNRLSDKAQLTISNLNNELSQLTDLYNNGIGEVNALVSRQSADFSNNQQLNAQKLQYLLSKAETLYSDKQAEKSATSYKYLPDYLQAKAKAQKPDTIGSAETGFFKWDPDTGTFIQITSPQAKLPASAQEYEYAKAQGFQGSYNDYQTMDANRKRSITNISTGGLTPGQVNSTVNQIAGAFDNEPVVRQYNVINEGYQFAKSLSNNTNNPSDDQGLIYAFAKAMDPGSVVREGEYATVQKYAQSWIKSFGKGVEQAINGTGFLSSSARANIKATIEAKYKASQQNYQQVYSEYQRQIQDAYSGNPRQITNYGGAYNGNSNVNLSDLNFSF